MYTLSMSLNSIITIAYVLASILLVSTTIMGICLITFAPPYPHLPKIRELIKRRRHKSAIDSSALPRKAIKQHQVKSMR